MRRMEEKILSICRKICCREITDEEELILSGILDSFKIMELICELEGLFGITFVPDEIMDMDNFSTVHNMAELVRQKLH